MAGAAAGLLAISVMSVSVLGGSAPPSPETSDPGPASTAADLIIPPPAQAQVSVPAPEPVPAPAPAAPAPPSPAAPRPAPAPSSAARATGGSVADKGAAALAMVRYPIDQTGFRVVFEGERSGVLGLTSAGRRTITVYVRSSQSVGAVARVLAHEVGHAVDFSFTTEAERSQYRAIRGIGDASWFSACDSCSDYASPAGDFAEVFAYWLMGEGPFLSTVAGRPTSAQLQQLGPIFAPSPPPPAPVTTTTTTPPTTAAPTTTTTTPPATWSWPYWPQQGTSGTPYPWSPRR